MNRGQLVSIIVTTKNEQDVIKGMLISCLRQTYQNIEIILIDNNSKDLTQEIAKRFTKKIFNFGPERSAQRNFGAKQAKGEYLLFLDADMTLSPKVLEEGVKAFKKDEELGGVVIPEKSVAKNFWEKVKAYERSFYNEEGDLTTDAARFFKKEAFKRAKGYDETITGPEDWDLTEIIKKLGYRIGRISYVIYHHERIPSLFSLAKKKFYYGLWAHKFLSKQNISAIGPKTVYFLRPVFYKKFDKMFIHPILSVSMFFMLFVELTAGGLGYFFGRIRRL